MAFSPNGDLLAVSMDGVVGLWNIRPGQCVQKTRRESSYLTFSHDGKWLFSCSSASIDVIEVGRKEMFSQDPNQRGSRPGKVLISPQGELVAAWQENVMKLWRLDSTTSMHELRDARVGNLLGRNHWEFSPDSAKIFSKPKWSLILWDISSKIEKRVLDIAEREESPIRSFNSRLDGFDLTGFDLTTGFGTPIFSSNSRFLAAYKTLPRSPNISSSSWRGKCTHIKLWDTVSGNLSMFLKSKLIIRIDLEFSPDSKRIAISFDFDNNGIRTTRIELWDIASSSGTSCMVFSDVKLTDHFHKKIKELENGAYKRQSIYKRLSFVDSHNLAFRYRHYRGETQLSDVVIQIVLTISPSIMSRSEINDEALLTTEKSSFDIGSPRSWVTLDGERLIWLPPEYRSKTFHHARFNCVATSNESRPLSILKFCCSKCPRQAIALDGPTKCTSNSSAEEFTYKQKIDGDFIILRLDMDSPDHEMLELYQDMLETEAKMLELEAKEKETLRKEWRQFRARFLTSKDWL